MALALFALECILVTAVAGFRGVREITMKLQRRAEEFGARQSMAHTYFANMGGFVLRCQKPRKD